MNIYQMACYFAVYSLLGWVVEVIYCTLKSGVVANRGFLNGPVCPVYGFGMLAVTEVSGRLPLESAGRASFVILFFTGMILASTVELIAGWALFHLFHARWWDYSQKPMNIGGYICLEMSIVWGLGTILMVDCVHPLVADLASAQIPMRVGLPILAVFYGVMAADCVVTASIAVGLNKHLEELDEIRASMRVVSDVMSEKLGEGALQAERRVDEGRVQAALAREELRDLTQEKQQEMVNKALARKAELEQEYQARSLALKEKRNKLRTQLTGGPSLFGPRRLLKAFPHAMNHKHESLWATLLEDEEDT